LKIWIWNYLKKEIDVANKDKNCKIFQEDFKIRCSFKPSEGEDSEEEVKSQKENGEEVSKDDNVEENGEEVSKDDNGDDNGEENGEEVGEENGENDLENSEEGKKIKTDEKRKSFYNYQEYKLLEKDLEFSQDEEDSTNIQNFKKRRELGKE